MFYLILKNKSMSQRTQGNRRCLTPKKKVYIYKNIPKRWQGHSSSAFVGLSESRTPVHRLPTAAGISQDIGSAACRHGRAEAPQTITSLRLILPLTHPPVTAESVGVKLGVRQHKLPALRRLPHSLLQLTRMGIALALRDNAPSWFAAPEANLQFYSVLFDFYRKASIETENSKLQPGRSSSTHSRGENPRLKHTGPTFVPWAYFKVV